MELYLIRHTTPDVASGVCYGQADLDVTKTFTEEAACIAPHLPPSIKQVWSSPLQRCRRLAETLFPAHQITFDDRLKEINCGDWELAAWDAIEKAHLDAWMADQVDAIIPSGESYRQLHHRVIQFFETLPTHGPIAVVTHGGVIRSLLAHISGIDLKNSFGVFGVHYGCTLKILAHQKGHRFQYLHNPFAVHETHRPAVNTT